MEDGEKIKLFSIVPISIIIILYMEITIQQNILGTDWLFIFVIQKSVKKKVRCAKIKPKLKIIFIKIL